MVRAWSTISLETAAREVERNTNGVSCCEHLKCLKHHVAVCPKALTGSLQEVGCTESLPFKKHQQGKLTSKPVKARRAMLVSLFTLDWKLRKDCMALLFFFSGRSPRRVQVHERTPNLVSLQSATLLDQLPSSEQQILTAQYTADSPVGDDCEALGHLPTKLLSSWGRHGVGE